MSRSLIFAALILPCSFAHAQVATSKMNGPSQVASAPQVASSYAGASMPCEESCWFATEYLLWWLRSGPTPPLVTSGDPASRGILGAPGTAVLFGGDRLDYGTFSGLRLKAGAWIDEEKDFGVEVNGFLTESRSVGFQMASNASGSPAIFVPAQTSPGVEGSFTLATPLVFDPVFGPFQNTGAVAVASSTRLWGSEINGLYWREGGRNFDMVWLAGFRYLSLQEDIRMRGFSDDLLADIQIDYRESFATRNDFYGPQAGLRVRYGGRRWSLDTTGLIALGNTHQSINVTGSNVLTGTGVVNGVFPGGVLTQPSNLGRRSFDQFSVVPSLHFRYGYDLSNYLRAFVGYDVLYWTGVVRPGDQIDRNVNFSQSPAHNSGPVTGPATPQQLHDRSDFLAHGINFGIELFY